MKLEIPLKITCKSLERDIRKIIILMALDLLNVDYYKNAIYLKFISNLESESC